MILTLKNQIAGTRSYLGGAVTVTEGGSTTLPRELNVIIASDGQFVSDCNDASIFVNNGATDLSGPSAIRLLETLANFSTDPIATLFLYYSAPIKVSQTTTSAIDTTVWTMRNPGVSPYSLVLENMFLNMIFDEATPIARKNLVYSFSRFTTATPSGGTQITPFKHSTSSPASGVDVRILDTGLTTTNVVFENPFDYISVPAVSGVIAQFPPQRMNIKLAAGDGLAIRIAETTALAGMGLNGKIIWSLR